MRKLRKPASAGLVGLIFVLVSACGGGSNPSGSGSATACVNSSAAHKAWIVVEHLSGKTVDKCVGFAGSDIAGDQLMKQSGIVYQTQHFSFGDAVCAIDAEPKTFDQCLPQNAPYWALWTEAKGGAWQQAQVGFADLKLADGGAIGWRYTPSTDANPSPPPAPAK